MAGLHDELHMLSGSLSRLSCLLPCQEEAGPQQPPESGSDHAQSSEQMAGAGQAPEMGREAPSRALARCSGMAMRGCAAGLSQLVQVCLN